MATLPAEVERPAAPKVPVATGGKVAAFVPQTMEEAWRLAGALAASGMTPKAYGNDQNKVMVGIMAGAEVGLTPFSALQSIAVIGNNPSLWGDGALALVQASGLLEDMEETDDGNTATCRLNRAGRATPIVRSFSMEDAKKAGLAGKAGPWTQYPARMRQMRARAFALRDGFSDVLKGLHVAEEARDYVGMGGGEALPANEPLTATALLEQARPTAAAEERTTDARGMTEVDEDAARALDAGEGVDEADQGDADEASDPKAAALEGIKAQIGAAKNERGLKAVEGEWLKIAAMFDDAEERAVDDLLRARRAALRSEGGEGGK